MNSWADRKVKYLWINQQILAALKSLILFGVILDDQLKTVFQVLKVI